VKKILTLAIILLTLLPATEVSAQNYSSETSLWDLINKAWNNAMESDADIYTDVYDDLYYDFDDYSGYGDFKQEVAFENGIRYLYGYDSSDMASSTVGSSVTKLSNYPTSNLRNHDLIVLTNGNAYSTLKQVLALLLSRTRQTGTETATIALYNGNYVVFKDKGNKWNEANVYHDKSNPQFYDGVLITNFYHTHPYVNMKKTNNPLYISNEDRNMVDQDHFNLDFINILAPDGTLYSVNPNNWNDITTRFNIYQ
jgi:hypothetical protein